MKVKDLIKKLQKYNPDDLIVLSSDEEGNSYSEAYQITEARYCDGEIGFKKLTPSLIKEGYIEEDVMKRGQDCIVLWP